MPTAGNASLMYEVSQSAVDMAALTDSGDRKFFSSESEMWSDADGYTADVRPDGVMDNATITPATGNDAVAVAAFRAYLGGVERTVNAVSSLAITRPSTENYQIYSVILGTDGSTVSVLEGTEGTVFSETRDAAGGPPLITVGAIELGQVKVSSQTPAAISTDEIFQVVGKSQERFDFPAYNAVLFNVSNNIIGSAGVRFYSALPAIHVGALPKKVYASYYEPDFVELENAFDFKPAETSHSTSSKTVYQNVVGSRSSSLSNASFSALLKTGVDDYLLKKVDQKLFFKFMPNYLEQGKFILTQGVLGVASSFPADDSISAACTISAEEASVIITG